MLCVGAVALFLVGELVDRHGERREVGIGSRLHIYRVTLSKRASSVSKESTGGGVPYPCPGYRQSINIQNQENVIRNVGILIDWQSLVVNPGRCFRLGNLDAQVHALVRQEHGGIP